MDTIDREKIRGARKDGRILCRDCMGDPGSYMDSEIITDEELEKSVYVYYCDEGGEPL